MRQATEAMVTSVVLNDDVVPRMSAQSIEVLADQVRCGVVWCGVVCCAAIRCLVSSVWSGEMRRDEVPRTTLEVLLATRGRRNHVFFFFFQEKAGASLK